MNRPQGDEGEGAGRMRVIDASTFWRGVTLGVAASSLVIGVVVVAITMRQVEAPWTSIRWALWAGAFAGAWGCLEGRRAWTVIPAVLLAPLWWLTRASAHLTAPSLGGVPVSAALMMVVVSVVGWVVAGHSVRSMDRTDVLLVMSAGLAAGVLVDPILVVVGGTVVAVVALPSRPSVVLGATVLGVAVAVWQSVIWWFAPDGGLPPASMGVAVLAGLMLIWLGRRVGLDPRGDEFRVASP